MAKLYPLLILFAGCAAMPTLPATEQKPPQLEWSSELQALISKESTKPVVAPAEWWKVFRDPVLDSLIAIGLENNLTRQEAESRIREAKAAVTAARSSFFPQIDLSASPSKRRLSENSVQGRLISGINNPSAARRPSLDQELYVGGFDALWEIDLFGETRREVELAEANTQATIETANDVLVSVTAEIARRYFNITALTKRLSVATANLMAQEDAVALAKAKYDAGLTSELDYVQAQAEVEATRSSIPALKRELAAERNALSILLVKPIDEINSMTEFNISATQSLIANAPEELSLGVPSELLRNRPDIRRAEQELLAQSAALAIAIVQRYPKVTLLGNFGLESFESSNFFEAASKAWSLTPSVSLPIFYGGRIVANITIQNEREQQALIRYQNTILEAAAESETYLTAFVREKERFQSLKASFEANSRAVIIAKELYARGLADFQRVLTAERSAFLAEEALAQSEQSLLNNIVLVYKSLGYGWQGTEGS